MRSKVLGLFLMLPALLLLAAGPALARYNSYQAGPSVGIILLMIALCIFGIVTMWKLFEKAGEPGWASIIPIYNTIIILKIAGKPGWWFFLLLIPIVNLIIYIMAMISLAENFGKGGGFAFGLILFSIIFFAILAFGEAEYRPTIA